VDVVAETTAAKTTDVDQTTVVVAVAAVNLFLIITTI
jgi:hypothetical protein